jgi:hypothetical protein
MAAERVAGVCYFKIAGAQYPLKGKFEYSPQMTIKEAIVGQDGVHGYKEMPRAPGMKAMLTDLGGISITKLMALKGVTFTSELANGKIIILRDGWVEGDTSVNSEDGSYDVEFKGKACQELTR